MLDLEYESGIYMIRNEITGDCYVGQSVNIPKRIQGHFRTDRKHLSKVQKQIVQYGKENFSIILLEECSAPEELDQKEIYWMDKLSPSLNTRAGGRKNKIFHHSEETKQLLREKAKQQFANMSDEEKQAQLNRLTGPRKGHPVSKAARAKLSAARAKQDLATPEIMEKRRQTMERKKAEGWHRVSPEIPYHRTPIVCNETGERFDTMKQASLTMGISQCQIRRQLQGKVAKAKGNSFSKLSVETIADECKRVGPEMSYGPKCAAPEREKI